MYAQEYIRAAMAPCHPMGVSAELSNSETVVRLREKEGVVNSTEMELSFWVCC